MPLLYRILVLINTGFDVGLLIWVICKLWLWRMSLSLSWRYGLRIEWITSWSEWGTTATVYGFTNPFYKSEE